MTKQEMDKQINDMVAGIPQKNIRRKVKRELYKNLREKYTDPALHEQPESAQ